ncbi:efflux RND transporter periplasmic adaptor subunit [Ningiella sp. W23]|uniref:efflux RND transporter periplasmic adaptor subunit n=1 Tax=Ningiella sp. W23 TaxID=3023715 RepID=UPI003756ACB1
MFSLASKTILLITCFSTAIFVLTTSPSSHAQYRGSDSPKLVVVEPLSFEYETSNIEAVGTAQAVRSVTLFAGESDEVTEVNFLPGDSVKKGEVLVALDTRLQDVAIERARIQLEDAKRNLSRVESSLARGAVTERELDDAKTVVRLAQVTLKESQETKENRLIRAPFDGVVGLTDIEVGDRVTPQTEITTLDDRRSLFVNFVAPELAVSYLMQKPNVELQPWTDRSLSLSAQIGELDSRVSTDDRTIRARALLDNSEDLYRPGMSFRVSLNVQGERFVAIPEAALSWGASGAYVWLSEQATAKRVDVQVEQRLRGRILVSGKLQDGETLIIEGIQGLRNGQALDIQNKDALGTNERRFSQKQSEGEVTS